MPVDLVLEVSSWGGTAMRFLQIALSIRSFLARTFTTALALTLLLAMLCQSQAADPEPKRVMMLHSFGPQRAYFLLR